MKTIVLMLLTFIVLTINAQQISNATYVELVGAPMNRINLNFTSLFENNYNNDNDFKRFIKNTHTFVFDGEYYTLSYDNIASSEDKYRDIERELSLYLRVDSGNWKKVSPVLKREYRRNKEGYDVSYVQYLKNVESNNYSYVDDKMIILLLNSCREVVQGNTWTRYYYNSFIFLMKKGDDFKINIFEPVNKFIREDEIIYYNINKQNSTYIINYKEDILTFTINEYDINYKGNYKLKQIKYD